MPFGKTREAATYNREILRVWTGSEVAENALVDGRSIALNGDGRRILEEGTVMVYVGVGEEQTLTIDADDGTFTIDTGSDDTGAIDYDEGNLTAETLEAALIATDDFAPGDIAVSGPAGGPYVLNFSPLLGNPAQLTATDSLTGGAGTATFSTTRAYVAPAKGQKVQPAPASGVTSGQVAGIVMATAEFWPDDLERDKDDKPIALFTKNCHFAEDQLTGYSGNSTAVKAAMTGAGNGRCANCTFES